MSKSVNNTDAYPYSSKSASAGGGEQELASPQGPASNQSSSADIIPSAAPVGFGLEGGNIILRSPAYSKQPAHGVPDSTYWSVPPRRFVLASGAFILGTAYGAFKAHWLAPAETCMFLVGLLPLLGYRAKCAVLIAGIMLAAYANAELRAKTEEPPFPGRKNESGISALVGPFDIWGSKSRKRIGTFMRTQIGSQNGSLLASMVLGSRAIRVERRTKIAFRKSGLSHVLAASGFNLSILVASIYVICKALSISSRLRLLFGYSAMLLFLILAGPSPSVCRAFLMGAVLLVADSSFRKVHLPASLMLSAVLMLAITPLDIGDIGLQLSYLSTAGLILCAAPIQRTAQDIVLGFKNGTPFNPTLNMIPATLIGILSASLVAQAFVFPLQLLYFQQFNPYFLLANLAAAPFLPAISVAGFVITVAFLLESPTSSQPIATLLIACVNWLVECFRQLVSSIASLPFAQLNTCTPDLLVILCYYVLLFAIFQCNESWVKRLLAHAFMAVCILLLISLSS